MDCSDNLISVLQVWMEYVRIKVSFIINMDFTRTGNELIYLDPHTTQSFVDSEENGTVDDQSFHCQQAPHRMKIMNLDPSVALVGVRK